MPVNVYQQTAAQYRQQAIETASPEQILLMLYDGAIRFLAIAKNALEKDDIETAHHHLIKTQRILLEFMSTLDINSGGDTARNLYALYEYYHHRLVEANIHKDTVAIDEVKVHLKNLRDTWAQAIDIAVKDPTFQQARGQGAGRGAPSFESSRGMPQPPHEEAGSSSQQHPGVRPVLTA